jgi:hypothetical protein
MYSIKLEWKSFNLDLQAVDAWMKANCGDNYLGNSADVALTLWFKEKPENEEDVLAYWELLDEESDEAKSYLPADAIAKKIEELKEGMLLKSWDEMSAAERKLMLGKSPSREELGL